MPCSPLTESQFTPPSPGNFPGSGGFAIQIPNLNIPFPDMPQVDLSGLFDSLTLILPPGTIRPNLEPDFLNDVYGGINELLSKFTPFLMLYKFFLPVLNLILCIIEVLCALLNPFKLISAINRLFRVCIPEFLALFPFFALPIMILSLLLLVLTLIEYLITRILTIVEVIIANINILGMSASRLDNDSIIAIVKKIGDFLCLLQNLFVIFGIFNIIIQIIKAILNLSFRIPPCDDSNNSSDGCCTPDVCPDFIKNNDTITSNSGNFLYLNEVGIDSGIIGLPVPLTVSVLRTESWQFYDPNLTQRQEFLNITNAYDLPAGTTKVFFPAGTTYTDTTSPSSTPYTINFRFFYDPSDFGVIDPKGSRYMRIANAIIQKPPTAGVVNYNNNLISPFNGTLNLIGGVVTEDNGAVLKDSNGNTIPINKFIHRSPTIFPSNSSSFALPNDGYLFSDLTYDFSINHEVLLGAALITLGCIPEVALSKNFVNTTIGAQFNTNGAALSGITLPDVAGAQDCVTNAITQYRQNISIDSTNQFQTTVLNCLNNLQQQTTSAVAAVIKAGYDQYKSTFTIDPTIQFTTAAIKVSVSLNDSSSQSLTANIPASAASSLAQEITSKISFGEITQFSYDGSSFFTADITSKDEGNGTIEVAFDNKFISILAIPTDTTQSPSVTVKQLSYTFVKSPSVIGAPGLGNAGTPRRDEGDIARENPDKG